MDCGMGNFGVDKEKTWVYTELVELLQRAGMEIGAI